MVSTDSAQNAKGGPSEATSQRGTLSSEPPPPLDLRLLRRSRTDRVIGGVCGGLGRYFGVDPVLLRIVAVALALSGGAGVILYVVGWLLIPEAQPGEEAEPEWVVRRLPARSMTTVVGAVLVIIGGLLFLGQLVPWIGPGLVWPLLLVAVGVVILLSARR